MHTQTYLKPHTDTYTQAYKCNAQLIDHHMNTYLYHASKQRHKPLHDKCVQSEAEKTKEEGVQLLSHDTMSQEIMHIIFM